MARESYFKNIGNITKVSFGLVTVLIYSYLLFHTFRFVSPDQEVYWWTAIISYSVMLSLIMGVSDMRNKLFNVSAISFVIRFAIFYIPCIIVLRYLLSDIQVSDIGLLGVFNEVPIWLLFIHAFVFATIESVIWQGYLDYKIGHPWSELVAGVFHWGIWTGGALFVIPAAGFLFMCFSLFNWWFRNSKSDLAPAIALHSAFNHTKLLVGVP